MKLFTENVKSFCVRLQLLFFCQLVDAFLKLTHELDFSILDIFPFDKLYFLFAGLSDLQHIVQEDINLLYKYLFDTFDFGIKRSGELFTQDVQVIDHDLAQIIQELRILLTE